MKTDLVRTIIAVLICGLLGLLCHQLVPETGNLKWIALAIATLGLLLPLLSAMAFSYPAYGNRALTIKLFSWVVFVLVLITCILFSVFAGRPAYFASTVALEVLFSVYIVYAMAKSRKG